LTLKGFALIAAALLVLVGFQTLTASPPAGEGDTSELLIHPVPEPEGQDVDPPLGLGDAEQDAVLAHAELVDAAVDGMLHPDEELPSFPRGDPQLPERLYEPLAKARSPTFSRRFQNSSATRTS